MNEADEDWNGLKRLVRGNGIIASEDGPGGYHYYHQNEHGDTELITSTDGQIQNAYSYDVFGKIRTSWELIENRYTYYGEQYDKVSEQYYLRARYYNPAIARFTQEDEYRGDGLNLYAYCANNPVMYVDPSGYAKTCDESKKNGNNQANSDIESNSYKRESNTENSSGNTQGGSQAYKSSADIPKDILDTKPKNSPNLDKWYKKGGTVSVDENGTWTFNDWEGNSVSYPNGYPDFSNAKPNSMVRQQVDLESIGDYNKDFANADANAPLGKKLDSNTWHHHENKKTMQEVSKIYHRRFTHRGGMSSIKESE